MKRFVCLILAFALIFSLAACGGGSEGGEQAEELDPVDPVEDYKEKLTLARDKLNSAIIHARITVGFISTVMSNAYDKTYNKDTDPFTTLYGSSDGPFVSPDEAAKKLFADEAFKKELAALEEEKNELAEMMEALLDPPEKYAQAEAAFHSAYMAYLSLAGQAVPSDNVVYVMLSFISASQECRETLAELDKCLEAAETAEEATEEAAG